MGAHNPHSALPAAVRIRGLEEHGCRAECCRRPNEGVRRGYDATGVAVLAVHTPPECSLFFGFGRIIHTVQGELPSVSDPEEKMEQHMLQRGWQKKVKSPRREVVRSSAGASVVYPPFLGSFA